MQVFRLCHNSFGLSLVSLGLWFFLLSFFRLSSFSLSILLRRPCASYALCSPSRPTPPRQKCLPTALPRHASRRPAGWCGARPCWLCYGRDERVSRLGRGTAARQTLTPGPDNVTTRLWNGTATTARSISCSRPPRLPATATTYVASRRVLTADMGAHDPERDKLVQPDAQPAGWAAVYGDCLGSKRDIACWHDGRAE